MWKSKFYTALCSLIMVPAFVMAITLQQILPSDTIVQTRNKLNANFTVISTNLFSPTNVAWGLVLGTITNQTDLWIQLTNRYTKVEANSTFALSMDLIAETNRAYVVETNLQAQIVIETNRAYVVETNLQAQIDRTFYTDGSRSGSNAVFGNYLSVTNMDSSSYGNIQMGMVSEATDMRMYNSVGCMQMGIASTSGGGTGNTMSNGIGSLTLGYSYRANVTNKGYGNIQLISIQPGEDAYRTASIIGNENIGLGACTITNDQSIVVGNLSVSHGNATITAANGFWSGNAAFYTNINGWSVNTNILPAISNMYDLGSSVLPYRNGYFDGDVYISGSSLYMDGVKVLSYTNGAVVVDVPMSNMVGTTVYASTGAYDTVVATAGFIGNAAGLTNVLGVDLIALLGSISNIAVAASETNLAEEIAINNVSNVAYAAVSTNNDQRTQITNNTQLITGHTNLMVASSPHGMGTISSRSSNDFYLVSNPSGYIQSNSYAPDLIAINNTSTNIVIVTGAVTFGAALNGTYTAGTGGNYTNVTGALIHYGGGFFLINTGTTTPTNNDIYGNTAGITGVYDDIGGGPYPTAAYATVSTTIASMLSTNGGVMSAGAVIDLSGGAVSNGNFYGNGPGITNINVTNLFGTIPDARLSSAVITNGGSTTLRLNHAGTNYMLAGEAATVNQSPLTNTLEGAGYSFTNGNAMSATSGVFQTLYIGTTLVNTQIVAIANSPTQNMVLVQSDGGTNFAPVWTNRLQVQIFGAQSTPYEMPYGTTQTILVANGNLQSLNAGNISNSVTFYLDQSASTNFDWDVTFNFQSSTNIISIDTNAYWTTNQTYGVGFTNWVVAPNLWNTLLIRKRKYEPTWTAYPLR